MNILNKNSIFMLLVCVGLSGISVSHAQNDKGKISKSGQLQEGLKSSKTRKKLPVMGNVPIKGKVMEIPEVKLQKMAPFIQKNQRVLASKGESMPAFDGKMVASAIGKGMQQAKLVSFKIAELAGGKVTAGKKPKTEPYYYHMVIEVSRKGDAKIISAVKARGKSIINHDVLGDVIYQINVGNKPVLVQAIADPFQMRSFAGPEGSGLKGHHFEESETARIVVKMPSTREIDRNLHTLKLEMYRIKAGPEINKIDLKVFNKLQKEKRLKTVIRIPAAKLAPQLKQKLIVMPK